MIKLDGTPNLSHLQEAAHKYGLTSSATELSYLIHTSCVAYVQGGVQSTRIAVDARTVGDRALHASGGLLTNRGH